MDLYPSFVIDGRVVIPLCDYYWDVHQTCYIVLLCVKDHVTQSNTPYLTYMSRRIFNINTSDAPTSAPYTFENLLAKYITAWRNEFTWFSAIWNYPAHSQARDSIHGAFLQAIFVSEKFITHHVRNHLTCMSIQKAITTLRIYIDCGLTLSDIWDMYYELIALDRFYHAKARIIQRRFRRVISDPNFAMCRHRLQYEFDNFLVT